MSQSKSYSKLGNVYSLDEIKKLDKNYHQELIGMRKNGANSKCADCDANFPGWASCNLGIFLCINCAQIHRGIGTHISKIKSCMGTYLWHPDEMQRMREIGNESSNSYYLSEFKNSNIQNMQQHITDKYVNKKWVLN